MTHLGAAARRGITARGWHALDVVAQSARTAAVRAPRPLRWVIADPHRMVTLAWMIALLVVGHGRAALADEIIVGPDLAHGAAKTLFETYGFTAYGLTVKPDEGASGWLDVGLVVWQVLGIINLLVLWLCLGLFYGALTLLEWLLHLTIYADSAGPIDQAVTSMASSVFWPLIAATVAIGAFSSYARWRGEGRGYASDLVWVITAAILGAAFVAGPSQIMSTVDGLRQELSTGVISGASRFVTQEGNPVGFPSPSIGGDPTEAGTRKLVDGVWNTFGATSWCYAQFGSLDVCKAAGAHALANDETWKQWMQVLDDQGEVPEFGSYGHYIRGQDPARLGMLLVIALITLPMAWLLLRLVIAGLTALVGFLLMLCVSPLFLALLPMPGWPRTAGTRAIGHGAGMQFQALVITVITSGAMVVTVVIYTLAGKYGFFAVGLLNLAQMNAATKIKAMVDNLIGQPAARSMGVATYLITRSLVRTVPKVIAAVAGGGAGLAAGAVKAVGKAGLRQITGGLSASGPGFTMTRETADLDSGVPGQELVPSRQRSYRPPKEVSGPPTGVIAPYTPPPKENIHKPTAAYSAPTPYMWSVSESGETAREARPNTTERVWRIWTVPPEGRQMAPPDKTPPPPKQTGAPVRYAPTTPAATGNRSSPANQGGRAKP